LVSRSHFAVGHFLGYVGFPRQAPPATVKQPTVSSSGFAFLQSIAQHDLVCRPGPADSSLGLSLPTALQGTEVHFRGFASPATFRLQGLATLLTAYSLRAHAGSVSHRRRSWDSPFGAFPSRKVSGASPPGSTHVPFAASVIPPPKRWAGPTGRGFWVSALPGVPGRPARD